jgi:hypothetical protein
MGTGPRSTVRIERRGRPRRAAGVRIHVEHAEVPEEFVIIISGVPNGRRECRVIWRPGFEIGAEFTDIRRGFASNVVAAGG